MRRPVTEMNSASTSLPGMRPPGLHPGLVELGERVAHVVGHARRVAEGRLTEQHPLDADEMGELVTDRPARAVRGQVPLARRRCRRTPWPARSTPRRGGRPPARGWSDRRARRCLPSLRVPGPPLSTPWVGRHPAARPAQPGRLASMASMTSGASGSTIGRNRWRIGAVRRHQELLEVPLDVTGLAVGVGNGGQLLVDRVAGRRR